MKPQAVLLLGPPGSGKTSVCKLLDNEKYLTHLSFGEDVRKNIQEGTVNPVVQEHIDKGYPIPPHLVLPEVGQIVARHIVSHQFHPEHDVLLFDGIPRNEAQFLQLQKAYALSKVFLFFVNDQQLLFQRIKNNPRKQKRVDDQDDAIIQRRIDICMSELPAILSHFSEENIFRINSKELTIDEMANIVREKIL